MRFIKFIGALLLTASLYANEKIDINFKDLEVTDFITMVGKINNINFLMTEKISGKVDFVSAKPLDKDSLMKLLVSVLETKGFTITPTDRENYFQIVKSMEASRENLPINTNKDLPYMVTKIIPVYRDNVDIISSKIRHLLSKGAKLLTSIETNTIIITDYQENIDTISIIIRELDRDDEMKVEFMRVVNKKAATLVPEITTIATSIFNPRIQSNKISVLKNDSTNSVILVGKRSNIDALMPYIRELDTGYDEDTMITEVVKLMNSEAKTLQVVLKTLLDTKSQNDLKNTTVQPTKSALAIDEELNAIIISAPKNDLEYLKEAIKLLDTDRPQVYVKSRIIEISDTKTQKLGLKYGFEGAMANSGGFYSFATNLTGSAVTLSQELLSTIQIGTSTLTEGIAFGATMDFLATNGAANFISEPSVLCINNKESSIYVGTTESVLSSSQTGTSSTDLTRNQYTRQDIGLTLKVKPRLTNSDQVTLDISAILEDVIPEDGVAGLPKTTKRQVQTSAIVRNGETVILGGLTKAKDSKQISKIPILGDIPILGRVFRNESDSYDVQNIVIALTPYIVHKSLDLTELRQKLNKLNILEKQYANELEDRLDDLIKARSNKSESKAE